jgi:hypothetical protein
MSASNENNFEKEWQNAFDGAEAEPSTHVWAGIESNLSRKRFAYTRLITAIGVAICLGIIGGLWHQQSPKSAAFTQNNIEKTAKDSKNSSERQRNKATAIDIESEIQDKSMPTQNRSETALSRQIVQNKPAKKQKTAIAEKYYSNVIQTTPDYVADSAQQILLPPKSEGITTINKKQTAVRQDSIQKKPENALNLASLHPLSLSTYQADSMKIMNIDLLQPAFSEKPVSQKATFWISGQAGIGYFNPHHSINYQNYLNDYIEAHNISDVNVVGFFADKQEKNKYTVSYQAEINIGASISPRWQLRTGVAYLHLSYEQKTDNYFTDYQSGKHYAFLTDIVNNQLTNPTFVAAIQHHPAYTPNASNQLSLQNFNNQSVITLKSVTKYWSVPLQVGYALRPDSRRWQYTTWAGITADLFKHNSTGSPITENATRNDNNRKGVFTSITWNFSLGVEAEYKYNARWSALISPTYQRNINTATQSTYLSSRGERLNVNVGMRHRF